MIIQSTNFQSNLQKFKTQIVEQVKNVQAKSSPAERLAILRWIVLAVVAAGCMNRKPIESPAEVALRVCLARQLLKDGSDNVQVLNGSTTQNYLCSDLINPDGTAKK